MAASYALWPAMRHPYRTLRARHRLPAMNRGLNCAPTIAARATRSDLIRLYSLLTSFHLLIFRPPFMRLWASCV